MKNPLASPTTTASAIETAIASANGHPCWPLRSASDIPDSPIIEPIDRS